MNAPPFARLPLEFAVGPLLAEIDAIAAQRWIPHFNDGCHDGGWQGIALRAPGGDSGTLYSDPKRRQDVRDTAAMGDCPHICAALARIECPLHAVRVLRLAAGGVIREHRDDDLRFEDGEARLHIPLATSPEVEFYVDDARVLMEAGECWYLDLSRPHRVQNRGATDRIHLVVDCGVDDWLLAQLAASVPVARAPRSLSGQQEFASFRERVLGDDNLQLQLRAVHDAREFTRRAVELGAAHGFRFGEEDVRSAMTRGRQAYFSQWVF